MIIIEQTQNQFFPDTTNFFMYCPKCKKRCFWLENHWKVKCNRCDNRLPRHDKILFSPHARMCWHHFNNWMDK